MRRYFWEMFFGFVAAVVLALGPPIAFLMMPAAGMFLFVVPIWSIGAVCVLFFLFSIFGRNPAVIGVGLLVIAVALSPLGRASIAAVNHASQQKESRERTLRPLYEKCATGYASLKKPSAKYDLLVLDSINTFGAPNYDVADAVAVLTGMRVTTISRGYLDFHFNEAWQTTAEHANSCVGERDSDKVDVATPRLSYNKSVPFTVDVCLRRRKIPDPSGDQAPAIVLRRIPLADAPNCHVTEVVERTASGDVELGRVHYDSYQQRMYPDLPPPQGVPRKNWLVVVLSELLQQDLSDKALMGHAVEAKK
jgi:hypothetical protein